MSNLSVELESSEERSGASRSLSRLSGVLVAAQLAALAFVFLGHSQIRVGIERAHPSWTPTQISSEELAHTGGALVLSILAIVLTVWLVDSRSAGRGRVDFMSRAVMAGVALGSSRILLESSFPIGARLAHGLAALVALRLALRRQSDDTFVEDALRTLAHEPVDEHDQPPPVIEGPGAELDEPFCGGGVLEADPELCDLTPLIAASPATARRSSQALPDDGHPEPRTSP